MLPPMSLALRHPASLATTGSAWLAALCVSRFAASLAFMMVAAALPAVASAWAMTAREAGAIQAGFNLGYAVSLVASAWLADRLGAKRVLLWSCWLTAASAVAFAVLARSYPGALVLFAIQGLAQGGTYAPALMLVAQGVPSERRGRAVGAVIAAASLGYLAALALVAALADLGYVAGFAACATAPALGAAAATLGLRGRPNLVVRLAARPALVRRGGARVLTIAYIAHCWELLGMWAWMPAFLATALADSPLLPASGLLVGAAVHGSGCLAAITMGDASDRFGRRRVLFVTGAVGTLCSFAIGWAAAAPAPLLLALAALYGFAALGDSPVLSTAMTEAVAPARLGMALATRSLLGFGAGGLAPLAFGAALDAARMPGGWGPGAGQAWGYAFAVLGLGGVVATSCAALLPPARGGAGFRAALAHRLALHRQRQRMGELDARQLADLGITRAQAEREARKPFWRS
jgi:MFS family permease